MTSFSTGSHLEKSTNVRTLRFGPRAIGAVLRSVEAGSPFLAARLGEKLMFRTTRRPPAGWEQAVLARGRRFRVSTPSARLAAWTFGEGPAVILVHGWNGRAAQLAAFVDPLTDSGFRVVTFDAPGHGESEGTQSSLPEFADAVSAVVDAVRPPLGPAHAIIAHSMGGAAVTYAMSRFRRRPEVEVERDVRDAGRNPVRRFVFVAPPIDVRDFVSVFTRTVGLTRETQDELRRRVESRFAVNLDDLYVPALAREMNAPMLVVHDENDREVPLDCGRRLVEAWPHARLSITRGLGHVRILGDAEVIGRILSFVRA